MLGHLGLLRHGGWLALALGAFLVDGSAIHAQHLRGTPGAGIVPTGFPGLPGIPLMNNGTLMVSRNPNPSYPNVTPFAYIASLPLGDRLPYNGIFADPQMTPQSQFGPQFAQNIIQQLQQNQFGNPLGPVGNLLQIGLANQPFSPGVLPPPIQGARGGRFRPNYNPYAYNPFVYPSLGYNPLAYGSMGGPGSMGPMGYGSMGNGPLDYGSMGGYPSMPMMMGLAQMSQMAYANYPQFGLGANIYGTGLDTSYFNMPPAYYNSKQPTGNNLKTDQNPTGFGNLVPPGK